MDVQLEIKDGNPWYASPNIWVVSVDDPDLGPPGVVPVAGMPYLLKARVTNHGSSNAEDAVVRFYWSNPAIGLNRDTANIVGQSAVSLGSEETVDVLALSPWIPVFVNQGHECLLAEVFHNRLDPLPTTQEFNVSTDRHVAQRNVSVLKITEAFLHFPFEIHNPTRVRRSAVVSVMQGQIDRLDDLGAIPGLDGHSLTEARINDIGFVSSPTPIGANVRQAESEIEVSLEPFERTGLSVVGTVQGGETAVIHVRMSVADEVNAGGLSIIVLRV